MIEEHDTTCFKLLECFTSSDDPTSSVKHLFMTYRSIPKFSERFSFFQKANRAKYVKTK